MPGTPCQLNQQTLHLPCFLPLLDTGSLSLFEAKKATHTSRALHLLENSPASKPPFQVGTRAPHGFSLLGSNTPVQHPGG